MCVCVCVCVCLCVTGMSPHSNNTYQANALTDTPCMHETKTDEKRKNTYNKDTREGIKRITRGWGEADFPANIFN